MNIKIKQLQQARLKQSLAAALVVSILSVLSTSTPTEAASPTETQFQRAKRCIELKHIAEAQQILIKMCASPTAPVEALCLLAYTYLTEEKTITDEHLAEVDKLTKRALKIDPEIGVAYKLMAQGSNLQSKFDLAIVQCTKAIAAKKPEPKARLQRCLAYESLGKHAEALVDVNYYIEHFGGTADNFDLKGSILSALKRYDEAIVAYNESLKHQFRDWTIYRIVECYEQQKQYDKAAQQLTRLLKINAQDAEAYQTRGRMQGLAKHYNEAIADYTMAIKLEPHARFYRERAAIYKLMGRSNEAAADLRQAAVEDKSVF